MSRHGEISFLWADGEHTFRLGLRELRELQEKCDAGPLVIARRFIHGDWRIDDMREVVRLGLIGGGLEPMRAMSLVMRYVDERPLIESVEVAGRIINAALIGATDEEFKKKDQPESPQTSQSQLSTHQPANGDGAESTVSAL